MKSGIIPALIALCCFVEPVGSTQTAHPISTSASEEQVETLKGWITDTFRDQPLIYVLPVTVPLPDGSDWFSEQDLAQSIYLRTNPDLQQKVEGAIVSAHNDRDKRVQQARSDLIGMPQGSASFEAQRPLVFINPTEKMHSHDLLTAEAQFESPLKLKADVLRLVNNKLYATKFGQSDMPNIADSMVDFVNAEFRKLGNETPDAGGKLLKPCRVEVIRAEQDGAPSLWLGSDPKEHYRKRDCPYRVMVSPLLIRAIFVRSIGSYPYYALSELEASPGRRKEVGGLLLARFSKELHFVLAHEIGHLFFEVVRNTQLDDEECVDQAAFLITQRLDGVVSLGAFGDLLDQAVNEGHADLWALERSSTSADITTRTNLIRQKRDAALSPACARRFNFSHFGVTS